MAHDQSSQRPKDSPLFPTPFRLSEDPLVLQIRSSIPAGLSISRTEPRSVVLNGLPMTFDGNDFCSATVHQAPNSHLRGIQNRHQGGVYNRVKNGNEVPIQIDNPGLKLADKNDR